MYDSAKASKKVVAHIAHICRLSANFIFLLFLIGSTLSILGYNTDNLGTWRINFSNQLLERSHLPIIGLALYAISLMVNEDRKYRASVYWKQLTLICTLGILLYAGCLLNSSERAYSLMRRSFIPSVSLKENLSIIQSSTDKIGSIEEAKKALRNSIQRLGKVSDLPDNTNLESIKNKIKEIEETLITEVYKNQEKQFNATNRRNKFEATRYVIYSFIFIVFYLKLAIFFNRLKMSS